jgi:hypothetical protein
MDILNNFEIAYGSILGRDHLVASKNNHDAYAIKRSPNGLVAVVCDGCGSGTHSEVGSKIAANVISESIINQLNRYGKSMDAIPFPRWEAVKLDAITSIYTLAKAMGGSVSSIIDDYFLFTIIGTIIMPTYTIVFSIGDGVYFVNGKKKELGPFPGNEPPYFSYNITGSKLINENPSLLNFFENEYLLTSEIESLLIGTDGVSDLVRVAEKNLPGKEEIVGPISQFWENDDFFKFEDAVKMRLGLINRESAKLNPERNGLKKSHGLLPDDTTMVVIRPKYATIEKTV